MDEDLLYLRDNVLPDAVARLNAQLSSASAFVMRRSARSISASKTVNVGREEVTPDGIMQVTNALLSEVSMSGTFCLPERYSEVFVYDTPVEQPLAEVSLAV